MTRQRNPVLTDSFNIVFGATELEARAALAHLMEQLAVLGLPAHRAGDIQLVLAEVLNNVVEHAYQGSGQGEIHLHMVKSPEQLDFCVCDAGRPLPGEELPKACFPDLNVPTDGLPEGGFGWCLIHELTSALGYERVEGRNVLTLGFDLLTGA